MNLRFVGCYTRSDEVVRYERMRSLVVLQPVYWMRSMSDDDYIRLCHTYLCFNTLLFGDVLHLFVVDFITHFSADQPLSPL